ncbi:pseudouridylate synthase RPUSD4, mitochondrial-like [Eucyclogobius newberryi]|uniref:pseudouridylate synthase RPUSD4, mitochondrial-like n=1 Tax=Eucyclogobius newberryi TaxID=166745 RepID=UPI003B5A99A9
MNYCRSVVNKEFVSVLYYSPTRAHCRTLSTGVIADTDPGDKPRLRAVDLAQKIQKEKLKTPEDQTPVSALQQRVTELRRFTKQLQNVHPNVLAKHLHRGVLYQDKDLVIINKPYGIAVHDSTTNSISSVLPVLSKMMDGMKVKTDSLLLPCLGLEKEVTGVLPLARSVKAAEHIANLHRHNQVLRKYWAVTVGVPVPAEGIVDIPIIEREVAGHQPHYKMSLSPLFRMNDDGDGLTKMRAHRQAQPAVTKYKVLDSGSGCSLVELEPLTDVKHQLRVHMAFALSCPILGDHKYSHWNKLAPQKLPERILKRLKLEQSKSRNLPLHLHARELMVQQTPEIDLTCSLPKYFFQTLNLFRLTFTEKDK